MSPSSSPLSLETTQPTQATPSPQPAGPDKPPEGAALQTQNRKADHLRVCLEEDVQSHRMTNGLERYRFTHCCLPELNRADIDISTRFLERVVRTPLLISSMTGGTEQARVINQRLAQAAQRYGLVMGVGSQRVALENPDLKDTFCVRQYAPDALIFANLGAVQLNYDYGVTQCQKAVDWLEADALILHLNPLQEAVQTEGDVNFKGLLAKIEQLINVLPVPVIAKEVGNGISAVMARRLMDIGITAIDVAGAGGTSWARVESERAQDPKQRRLGNTFADWGISTAECIVEIRQMMAAANRHGHQAEKLSLIASGGLRNGLDAAKTLALGADLAGMAMPFLQAANQSVSALNELCEALIAEIVTVLFCTGCASLDELRGDGILRTQSS